MVCPQASMQAHREAGAQAGAQAGRQARRQARRQAGRQARRQAGRQASTQARGAHLRLCPCPLAGRGPLNLHVQHHVLCANQTSMVPTLGLNSTIDCEVAHRTCTAVTMPHTRTHKDQPRLHPRPRTTISGPRAHMPMRAHHHLLGAREGAPHTRARTCELPGRRDGRVWHALVDLAVHVRRPAHTHGSVGINAKSVIIFALVMTTQHWCQHWRMARARMRQ